MDLRIFLLVGLSLAVVLGQRREQQVRRQEIRRQEITQRQIIRQRQTSHGQTSHGQSSHGQTSYGQSRSQSRQGQSQTQIRQSQSRSRQTQSQTQIRQSQSRSRQGQGQTQTRQRVSESQRRIIQSQSRERRCAPGYYRARTGPYLGVCVPCQCNGRADTCDPQTGECLSCRDNFGGPQCLTCKQGYYHDERTRRCEICSCPRPVESNNFARTCQVYPQTGEVFRCECLQGYTGARCDSCDLGYWGNPNEIGGSCRVCQCNDNIDVRDPRSCDPYTGTCQICINNAAGPNCERCADWYFGDAVRRKNCRACTCNRQGTESCDHQTGACLCKPNVIGRECDRCGFGSFGFERGQGCQLCDCGVGASNTECDPYTGQCTCHVGVTGRRCDQCLPGYWNLSPNGCERCQCGSDGANSCDPRTGRCECLPGVAGAGCGRCLDRWIFLPDQGCQECDSCIHLLLDDLEIMDHNVSTIVGELEHVSVGVGAIRRLDQISDTVHQLRPLVDDLIRDPRNGALDPLWRELEKLRELKERVYGRAQRTDNEADVVLEDAMKTDRDASDLLILVRQATEETNSLVRALISIFTTGQGGSIAFAQEVLQDILNSIQSQNVDAIIAEAERILEEIKRRDFSLDESAANNEYGLANETLAKVQALFNRAMEQADEINRIAGKLDGVEDKLRDLLNNSRHSIDNSQAALDLIKRGEGKKAQIQGDILAIKELRDDINMMLDMAQQLIEDAREFLDEARAAHFATERESTRLEAAMDDLREFVDNLAAQNEQLRPLVEEAMRHALDLQKQAEMLAGILEDTKISAGGAVNASKAYQAIVDAINAADAASKAALESAIEALDFSNGLAERARKSKERSQELKTESEITKDRVRDELRPRLREAKRSVSTVERLNQETEEGLTDLLLGLDMLPDGGYGDRAQEAAMKAMNAQQRAEDAANKIEDILGKLPEDQRKINEIPKDIADANRDMQRAQNQVDQVQRLIPDATALIDKLTIQADKVNTIGQQLTFDITALREKIALSREEASRIRVGVTFMRNTTLQLRNPKSIAQAGSYTKLSIFFKTAERNGFLAYIGPDRTSERKQTNDFMALEIMDGKVVFKFNLGASTTIITNPKEVSDNEWHEAIVERTGKTVSLIVRTEDEDDSVEEGESPGTYSVLDLDPVSSKFYVGGVPENVGLEDKLSDLRFVGCIEDVKFDGLPIGMWDFVHGENNHRGCLSRDKLLGAVTNGFRFDGNGVVVLDRDRFRPSKASVISLKFKTYADNGLMLLVGEDRDFMSLELHDGKVLFQYDLGSGRAMLESTERYSDGQWHTVVANRLKQDGLVKVDGVTVATGRSPGDLKELSITDDIFIGGHRGQHNYPTVTQDGFDGCIKDVQLGSALRDINDNTYALGVLPGCPEVARIVSFSQEDTNSYIAMDPVNVDQNFQATMKVKTVERDGLIFYVADDTQSNSFAVSLVDGRIVVSSNPEGNVNELSTEVDTYNDGHWHYITVTKMGRNLQLDIDDTEMVNTRADGRRRIVTTSPLYFGGVPPGYAIVSSNVASERTFVGCIGDVTVNGGFVNFALAPPTGRDGASLAGCPIADPVTSTVRPTVPLPTIPVDTGVIARPTPRGGGGRIIEIDRGVVIDVDRQGGSVDVNRFDGRIDVDRGEGRIDVNRYDGSINVNRYDYDINRYNENTGVNRYDGRIDVDRGEGGRVINVDRGVIIDVNRYDGRIDVDRGQGRIDIDRGVGGGGGRTVIDSGRGVEIDVHRYDGRIDVDRGQGRIDIDRGVGGGGSRTVIDTSRGVEVDVNRYDGRIDVDRGQSRVNVNRYEIEVDRGRGRIDVNRHNVDRSGGRIDVLVDRFGDGGVSREQCALPLRPEEGGVDSGDASGTRFGGHPGSRLEYTASEIPGNTRSESEFSFDFKSTGRDGILFYAYGDRHVDFIAVYLTGGQIGYAFNCGSGTARMISPNTYNDGQWHSVVFWRRQTRGRLVIDEEEVGEGRSGGNQKSINVVSPFFVGGFPRDPRENVAMASSNMDGITQGFSGCIRNLQLDGIPFGVPTEHHVEPCTSSVESGSFFSVDGGYVTLHEQFKVGLDLDITLDIRPRSLSGVILSVYSTRGDYLVLQMQDGNIIFSVDNGGGNIETTYNTPAKNGLCDGGWHTIKAVKAKNVVTLYVDEIFTYPGIGEAGVSSTDTNDPLYIGGVPDYHKGIKTREQFVGCIRNVQFNSRAQNLSSGRATGRVNLNSCPTT